MIVKILPSIVKGSVVPPASKSEAHRALICAALSNKKTTIYGNICGDDVDATISCLTQLGAEFIRGNNFIEVKPIDRNIKVATMYASASGSTLRFMLCLCAMLGITVHMDGINRLRERPLDDLVEVFSKNGITFSSKTLPFTMSGKLNTKNISISASVSSQYVTGLMLGAVALNEEISINVVGDIASRSYIELTSKMLNSFGIKVENNNQTWTIYPHKELVEKINIGGDWSGAAAFVVLGAINGEVKLSGLDTKSSQGDKEIIDIIKKAGGNVKNEKDGYVISKSSLKAIDVDATNIPDLVPVLAILLSQAKGVSTISGVERLKVKESDRLAETINILNKFNIKAETDGKILKIYSGDIKSANIDLPDDHRMAMMSAIAATIANGETTINRAECVSKSYPSFFEDLKHVGGQVNELNI